MPLECFSEFLVRQLVAPKSAHKTAFGQEDAKLSIAIAPSQERYAFEMMLFFWADTNSIITS
ncbi:hypothetical protein QUB70_02580 [Microcoleus sp. A003_D6]|uniref:hypothetical protein n=1 Tax=Microcoleus sp. A003_D6 TaxID=3055266 RepID=UPI002FD5B8A0